MELNLSFIIPVYNRPQEIKELLESFTQLEYNKEGLLVPNRTFHGMKYHGGFSDHLPVYLDIENIKE